MDLSGTFPVTPHRTWDVYDASKVQNFMQCPRKHFFKYILGWRREGANVDLEFGTAWHESMAHILENDYSLESVHDAHKRFLAYYRQFFPVEMDEDFISRRKYKVPAYALLGLVEYINLYAERDKEYEVLTLPNGRPAVEIAGRVLISEKHQLYFRIDSILKGPNGIIAREHKTGSRVTQAWLEQWSTKMQIFVYTHALFCEYAPSDVWGVEVNGFFPQKKENKFERVDVRKSKRAMRQWLWEVNYWMNQIEWNFHQLRESSDEEPIMRCFPRNTESCTLYNRPCSFIGFCTMSDNPLKLAHSDQFGIEIDWWDPSDYEDKNVLEIDSME